MSVIIELFLKGKHIVPFAKPTLIYLERKVDVLQKKVIDLESKIETLVSI